MRLVIDTNVVVSAATRDGAPEELLLLVVSQLDWQWLVTDVILEEYLEVIRRPKFGLSSNIIARWGAFFTSATTLVEANTQIEFPRDPDDVPSWLALSLQRRTF